MSLYIGMRNPSKGDDNNAMNEAITFMALQVALEKRSGLIPKAGPRLDVTFLLPGKQEVPPFDGMRMGGYSDDGKTLFFEAAVPETALAVEHASEYVAAVMFDVVDNAIDFFAEGGVPFDGLLWKQVVSRLTQTDEHVTH